MVLLVKAKTGGLLLSMTSMLSESVQPVSILIAVSVYMPAKSVTIVDVVGALPSTVSQ